MTKHNLLSTCYCMLVILFVQTTDIMATEHKEDASIDTDKDGVMNAVDPDPLVSSFPIVSIQFATPVIGIKYKISGEIKTTETRTSSQNNVSSSTSSTTSSSTDSSTYTHNYVSKMANSVSMASGGSKSGSSKGGGENGGFGILPKVTMGFSNTGTDSSKSSHETTDIYSLANKQTVNRERHLFNETIKSGAINFDSDYGYIHSTLYATNYHESPITIDNLIMGLSYSKNGSTHSSMSGIKFNSGTVFASTGPMDASKSPSQAEAKPVAIDLPRATVKTQIFQRAVLIEKVNVGTVAELVKRDDVGLVLEDFRLTSGDQSFTMREYNDQFRRLANQLVLVRIDGRDIDQRKLISPIDENGRPLKYLDVISLAVRQEVELIKKGDHAFLKTLQGVASDNSWENIDGLENSDSKEGKWVTLVNNSALTDPNSFARAGDELTIIFITNGELKAQLFTDETVGGVVKIDTSKFYWKFSDSLPEDSAKLQTIKRNGQSMRHCVDNEISPGDVITVKVRAAVTRDQTESETPRGRINAGSLKNLPLDTQCLAKEFKPSKIFSTIKYNAPLKNVPFYLAFGESGPELMLSDLMASLPSSQMTRYKDGFNIVRFFVDENTIVEPTKLCFGTSLPTARGAIGRKIKITFSTHSGSAMQQAVNRGIKAACERWRDENAYMLDQEYYRASKGEFVVLIHKAMH